MDPGEIRKEVDAMSEYQAKLILSLMACFCIGYEEAKERANTLYDRAFEWERKGGN